MALSTPWAYALIAALTFFEGPIATLASAAAASTGLLNPYLVFLAAATGNLAGDTVWHLLGRAGKLEGMKRHGHRLGVSPDVINKLRGHFQGYTFRFIFWAKIVSSLIIPTLVATGLMRIPWRRWFPAILLGEILRTAVLVLVGFCGAQYIPQIGHKLQLISLIGSALLIVLVGTWVRRLLGRTKTGSWTFNEEKGA